MSGRGKLGAALPGFADPAEGLTIGEVSSRTGVAASALRFYEAEGLISSSRTSGGQRRYARDTLRRVSFMRIAQQVGLSLEDIRRALGSLPSNRTPNRRDWQRLSRSWRPRLDERIRLLERLRDDLSGCIGCGCLSLSTCPLYNPGDVLASKGPGARIMLGDVHLGLGSQASCSSRCVQQFGRFVCRGAGDDVTKRQAHGSLPV